MTLIGVSNNSLPSLEALLGGRVPVIRDYAWLGEGFPAAWLTLFTGRRGAVSWKFRDQNGGTIHATDVFPGKKWETELDQIRAGLGAAKGNLDFMFQHESNSAASGLAGTPAEIDAAVNYCLIRMGAPVNAYPAFCTTGWTVGDMAAFPTSMSLVQAHSGMCLIDQPYRQGIETAASAISRMEADVAFIKAHWPKMFIGIGEFGVAPGTDAADWLSQLLTRIKTDNMLAYALYWDSGSFALDNKTAPVLVAAMNPATPAPPPVPPSGVTVSAADWATLKSIIGRY